MQAQDLAVNLQQLRELPALPQALQDLLQTLADEQADRRQIIHEVSRDLSLSCKLLRIANSSFYGLSYQVASIQDAVLILGLRTLKSLTIATLMSSQIQQWLGQREALRDFFEHALQSAVYAQLLAEHISYNRDNAFTAGLLHDIGKLVLASEFPESSAQLLHSEPEWQIVPEQQEAVLKISHAELGQQVLQHWHFPHEVQVAVAEHHSALSNSSSDLTRIVIAANIFADLELTDGERLQQLQQTSLLWQALELSEEKAGEILARGRVYYAELLAIFAQHPQVSK